MTLGAGRLALREFLNDGVEGASLIMSRRSRTARLMVTVLVGGLMAYHFGAVSALVWAAANLVLEAGLSYLNATFRPREEGRSGLLMRLGPPLAFSTVWSVMAALSAIHGSPPMKFAALIILFGLIVEGLKYATVSWSAMLSIVLAPFAALVLAPLFGPNFNGWDRLVAMIVLVGLAGYIADAVRLMRSSAKALETAQAEAQAASRAKSAFVAMMSHELRTPMNGVLGLAHALGTTRLDDRQSDYLDMIVQSGDSLMTILNDILDLSKVEAGKLELEALPFDIRRLGAQIHLVCNQTAQLKGLTLTLEVAPQTPQWLLGDPVRVRQILLNLVSNALKFTEAGRVDIRIAPRATGGVELVISDTGVGLTEDQRSRLFSPFSQGDISTARRFGGTGLGLAICRQLALLMGGEITVASTFGQGSVFSVWLDLPPGQAPASRSAQDAALDLDGARVLVVDDNVVNQAVARAILESAQVTVATAEDGRAALARLRVEDFDLVLMDVHMPRMDGVEAVRRIRAGEGGRVDIPILALTADAMAGEAERLVNQGFDDAHPKPVQPGELLRAVSRLRSGSFGGRGARIPHDASAQSLCG